MRAIKPMHVGLLSRCFEHERRFYLNVGAMIGFSFDGSVRLMSEIGLWTFLATELGEHGVVDEALPKSRAEFLVRGTAYCPHGQPQATLPVKVRVGAVEKTLYVIGDRRWQDGVPTAPVPFTAMELTWARAYGGPGYARNPLGKGFAPIAGEDEKPVHPLPNVELPGRLIQSPGDRREPAGFMPFGFDWPQRTEKMGTFDERWLAEDFPGYPRDIDWSTFNVASVDQRQETFYVGDEDFACTNLHPSEPEVRGRLPRIQIRCFTTTKGAADPDAMREVPMRPTTLWLFPHAKTGVLIFHGAQPVGEDDAYDVDDLMLAAENLGEPRPLAHYQAIRAYTKTMEVDSVLSMVEGTGLVPEGCEGVGEMLAEVNALTPKGLAGMARSRAAIAEYEALAANLRAQGTDPIELLGPPPEPYEGGPPDLGAIGQIILDAKQKIEEQKAFAETKRREAEQKAREFCEENELDYEAAMKPKTGPPDFSAETILGQQEGELRMARLMGNPLPELEAMIADPEHRARIHAAEDRIHDAYRQSAHVMAEAPPTLDDVDAALRREDLLERVRRRESVRRRDYTGVDLSGEDLSGADLSGAYLAHARLVGCVLSGANLSETVLCSADLGEADLSGADLTKCNLGRASLGKAHAREAPTLTDAVLDYVDLTEAQLPGLVLHEVFVRDATLDRANLSRARLAGCNFSSCSMIGIDLRHADLTKVTFAEVEAGGMVASGATLEGASFHASRADDAKLDHTRATNFRVTGQTRLARVDFTGATLDTAELRELDLSDASFAGASLNRADLSSAQLVRANLHGVVAREALMIRTNFTDAKLTRADLMNALLSKADLSGADLTGSSLYGADLSRARSHGGTVLDGVDQTRARIHPTHAQNAQKPT